MVKIKNSAKLLLVLVAALPACGKGSRRSDAEYAKRLSRSVNKNVVSEKFMDREPAITADGGTVYFVSGRSEPLGYALYKKTVGSEDAVAEVVSDPAGWSSLNSFTISASGAYAIGAGTRDGRADLFLVRLDNGTLSTITDDVAVEMDAVISKDSSFIAYRSVGPGQSTGQLYVRSVDTTNFTVGDAVAIGEANTYAQGLTFAGDHDLYAPGKFSAEYQTPVYKIAFASIADASSAMPTTFASVGPLASPLVGAGQRVLAVSRVATAFATLSKRTHENGTIELPNPTVTTINSRRQVLSIATATGQNEADSERRYAIDASSPSPNADGTVVAWVESVYMVCETIKGDGESIESTGKKAHFGKAIRIWTPSAPSATDYLFPVKGDTGAWTILRWSDESFCNYVPTGEQLTNREGDYRKVDWFVDTVALNSAASSSAYVVAYVTSYTDTDCGTGTQILGDAEIRSVRWDGAAFTVSEISSNQATNEDCGS